MSYGSVNVVRAVEQLRHVVAELQIADVRARVIQSLRTDFENLTVFKPAPFHKKSVHAMLDQVIARGRSVEGVAAEVNGSC